MTNCIETVLYEHGHDIYTYIYTYVCTANTNTKFLTPSFDIHRKFIQKGKKQTYVS
jgi:hypothetical protein